MKKILSIPGIILLFTCWACKEKEAFRIPTEPERNYLMSHSTVTFKPELAALIDSFIHLHPDLEYNIYVDKRNEDSTIILLQGTYYGFRLISGEEHWGILPQLTRYIQGNVKVGVYAGTETFIEPLQKVSINYEPEKKSRNEAFWKILYKKGSFHVYTENANITPYSDDIFPWL